MKDKHFNHKEIAIGDKRKAYEEKFNERFIKWSAEIVLFNVKTGKDEVEAKLTDIYQRTNTTLCP